jgi:hypothetical protein
MARGRNRWSTKDLRHRLPLPQERRGIPRFDGTYLARDGHPSLRFAADHTARFHEDAGIWRIEAGMLEVVTPIWQCEGALDDTCAFLLCVPDGRQADREQHELRFVPNPPPGQGTASDAN